MTGGWTTGMRHIVEVCSVFFSGIRSSEDVPGVRELMCEEHPEQCRAHWKHSLNVPHYNDDGDVTKSERNKRIQSSVYSLIRTMMSDTNHFWTRIQRNGGFGLSGFLLLPPTLLRYN